jgi:demethylmenaquinone methyltransferase / 2-methoxy-6-polyprenyl-1,4-benzoquinol methylase
MTHLSGKERAAYVQDMFGRIAGRYNLMNRLISLGQDMKWRRFVVKQAKLKAGDTLLDLATGTGDIAFLAFKTIPGIQQVVGGDFSLNMMRVGMHLPLGDKVGWTGADALNLPFPDESFNAVTSGYLARNVIDIPRMFAEQLRVVKPGGRIVLLDSSPPRDHIFVPFIEIHLRYVIPTLGRIIAGKSGADAYQYLPASTQAFKSPEELADLMRAAGIKNVQYKTFMFETMAVHWGEK